MTLTILLCHERSGSHLLGEFLGSLDGVRMFDEVCNARSVQPRSAPESFHRFRYDAIISDPNILLDPTAERHLQFLRAYFAHLAKLASFSNIAVDIKYGHVINFEGWWWPITPRRACSPIARETASASFIFFARIRSKPLPRVRSRTNVRSGTHGKKAPKRRRRAATCLRFQN